MIADGLKGLVLGSPHLIDRLTTVLGNIELVVQEFRVRGLVGYRAYVGGEHVGGHAYNPRAAARP